MLLFVIILLSMKSFDCPVIYASRSYHYFIISKTYGQHSLCLHLRSLDDPGFYGKIVYIHDKDGQTMRKGPDSYAEECYCKKIRHIAAQVTRIYDQYLKEAGLTSQQFSTLEYIRGLGPVSVTELSREMGLDRTSLQGDGAQFPDRGSQRGRKEPPDCPLGTWGSGFVEGGGSVEKGPDRPGIHV